MVHCDRTWIVKQPGNMLTSQRMFPPQEPTFSGEVASGYLKNCVAFAVGASTTIAIASLDIITDWIMYRALLENEIPETVEKYTKTERQDNSENGIVWTLRGVYVNLTAIMQAFLILSSVVFCIYFWWFCYMIVVQRKQFKDKRDGVPRKKKVFERFGGEMLILLHVLFEDLPISVILLLAQISCSCTFLFSFDRVIYLLATCTTAFSLTWKLAQVTWNSGCFNFRDNYLCSNGLVVIRVVSLLFIVFTSALTSINFVLLRAGKDGQLFAHSTFKTSVFDKIGVDRYIKDRSVVLAQSADFQHIEVSNDWKLIKTREQNNIHMLAITSIQNVVDAIDDFHTVYIPCSAANMTFSKFFIPLHREGENQRNCSVIFRFHLQRLQRAIQYDARYTFYDEVLEDCVTERLQIDSQGVLDIQEGFNRGPSPELSTISNGDSSLQTSNGIDQSTGPVDPGEDPWQITDGHTQPNYLSFISHLPESKYKNCNLHLVPNGTLLSETEICVFSS